MEKFRTVQGADGEQELESILEDIVSSGGVVHRIVWKERPGYWVILYSDADIVIPM